MKKKINTAAFVLFLIGFIGGLLYFGLSLLGGITILNSPQNLANLAKEYGVTEEVLSQSLVIELVIAIISLIICVIFLIFACRNKSKPMGNAYPVAVLVCAALSLILTIILMGIVIVPLLIWIIILIASILQVVHKDKIAIDPSLYNAYDPYRQNLYINPYSPDKQGSYNPYAPNSYGPPQNSPFAPSQQNPYAPNTSTDPNAPQRQNNAENSEPQNNDKQQNPFEPPK